MYTKGDYAIHIVYWYKTAKSDFKEGLIEPACIAIGRGETYIEIARKENIISHEEWKLLRNAYNRLW